MAGKKSSGTPKRTWKDMSGKQKIIYVVVLVAAALAVYFLNEQGESDRPVSGSSAFEIRFLDVGQADSALILCDGKAMLIDGGNQEDSDRIYSALKTAGVSHLDYVVCTHAHEDHVGGLAGALNACTAGTVFCSVDEYGTKCFEDFADYTHRQGKEITIPVAGDRFELGSSTVTILGPVWDYEETNDQSIVLRIVYGETSFLFTGDATVTSEKDILENGGILRSTVLKVGHHGSDTSSSQKWLEAVAPEYAVISVGENNKYNHPHQVVLDRLSDLGIPVYRTDEMGMITCVSDGKTVSFYTEKRPV